jgi:hypothetical protein
MTRKKPSKEIQYKITDNGCHECISHCKDSKGYPIIAVNHKKFHMSRYIYELHHGPIPKGLIVRHKCDNPACINPDHLEIGTAYDNVHDMIDRGRAKYGNVMLLPLIGSKNKIAKLDEQKVIDILKRLEKGESQASIARSYGVNRVRICEIAKGKSWKHVKLPTESTTPWPVIKG